MKTTVTSKELRGLTGSARQARLDELSSTFRSPPNGEVKELEAQILEAARVLRVAPDEARAKVARGELRETAAVCDLLMLLKLRDRLAASVR